MNINDNNEVSRVSEYSEVSNYKDDIDDEYVNGNNSGSDNVDDNCNGSKQEW